MWPYWVMFLVPAWAALSSRGCKGGTAARNLQYGNSNFAWVLVFLSIALLIGFRHSVGGDWVNYFDFLTRARRLDLDDIITERDPGYVLFNWLSVQFDWGIYGVNLMCGVAFSAGLVIFCRSQPQPWLALAVSVPYLLIVVAMGYSRQGVALGLALIGLTALSNGSNRGFVAWTLLAATFHKSAVLLIPISALAASRNRYWTAFWVAIASLGAYYTLLAREVDALYTNYIAAQYQSEGALVRLLMNAIPAVIFLKWRRRFQLADPEKRLWTSFAILSLALLGLFAVSPSSTAVDRVALYMLPLQLVVAAHVPFIFGAKYTTHQATARLANPGTRPLAIGKHGSQVRVAVLLLYGLVQFVWLNFATNATGWVPYRFYLFE